MEKVFISGTNGDGLDEVKVALREYIDDCGHQSIISRFGHFEQDIPDVIKNCISQVKKCSRFILLINKTAGNYFDKDKTETITEAEFYEAFKKGEYCKIIIFVKSVTWHEYNWLKRLTEQSKSIDVDVFLKAMHAEYRVYDFIKKLDNLASKPLMLPYETHEDIKRQLANNWGLPPAQEVLYDGTEIYTENVYKAYREAQGKTILSYIATWPILPDKLEENETLDVKNWTIIGPITKDRMAGVLWRMAINKVRRENELRPIILLDRVISGTKFIVAGNEIVLIPIGKDPEERTRKHIIRRSEEDVAMFTERFFQLAQDAISAEEKVCKIIRDDIMVDIDHIKISEITDRLFEHWGKLSVKDIETIEKTTCQEVILECIKGYGDRVGMTYQGGRSPAQCVVNKKGQVKRRGIAMIDHRQVYEDYRTLPGKFPSVRVVVTNRCNLRCEYCPPDNENYASINNDVDIASLDLVLNAVIGLGCQKVCFTGGEPLLYKDFFPFLKNFSHKNPSVAISLSTNGSKLRNEMLEDLTDVKNITLKVSLDTLDRSLYKRITGQDRLNVVTKMIKKAGTLGICVGINFVLRRENKDEFCKVIDFARKHRAYVKILDLNWYNDIGKRKEDDEDCGDGYWGHNYYSADEIRNLVTTKVGPLRKVMPVGGYGIPMWETERNEGFFVRIKDWREGTHYSDTATCRLCEYFRNRKCHEGIYQLTFTSDLRLKICRHRPDLAVSLADSIQKCRNHPSNRAIQNQIRDVLTKYFYNSKLL